MKKIIKWLKKYNWTILDYLIIGLFVLDIIVNIVVINSVSASPIYVVNIENVSQDSIPKAPTFMNKNPKEGLKEALKYYDIKYPEIVYAQAVLETGNFTSGGCKRDNNLFGLYNSSAGQYFKFNHWSASVVAYKEYIQSKYKEGDYYTFLNKLGYATDPNYISKIKKIANSNK